MKQMEINHFSHAHPLVLIKDLKGVESIKAFHFLLVKKRKAVCYGCDQPVVSRSTTYCCSRCKVFLHKSCAELPLEITHLMHPQHPLKLFRSSPYGSKRCFCDICRKDCNGFTYHCSECRFDLDVLCAQKFGGTNHQDTSENTSTFKHASHEHPLIHRKRSALFKCDACGIEDKDELYECSVCSFWIHKTCGSLPISSSRQDHPHPLSLAYCLPEKFRAYGPDCEICREKLHPLYWVYYCGLCRYFVHLKCMTSESQEDAYNSDGGVTPDLICLPAEIVSSQLIRHFLKQNSIPQIELSTEINHFSHDHPLILDSVQDDYTEMTEDDEETVCNACAEPISGTCYSCVECKYLIHLDCAQLPKEISSSHHPQHKLSLSHFQEFFRDSNCTICEWTFNGFFYECKECDFLLDIKCALLPSTIKHEAHAHPLVRHNNSDKLCKACLVYHGADVNFGCEHCDFNLAMRCALWPRSVRHRWDEHPLVLSFPPFYYHPDEFICDMCEYEIHPKCWLYHCRECDNSFHPLCVPRLRFVPYLKFGGTLQIDYHPHPLTYRRKPRYKSHCDKCGTDLSGYTVYECESCLLPLCCICVIKIVDSSRKVSNPKTIK